MSIDKIKKLIDKEVKRIGKEYDFILSFESERIHALDEFFTDGISVLCTSEEHVNVGKNREVFFKKGALYLDKFDENIVMKSLNNFFIKNDILDTFSYSYIDLSELQKLAINKKDFIKFKKLLYRQSELFQKLDNILEQRKRVHDYLYKLDKYIISNEDIKKYVNKQKVKIALRSYNKKLEKLFTDIEPFRIKYKLLNKL